MKSAIRVLIVEDAPDDAELIAAALSEQGFTPCWHRVDNKADYLAHLDSIPDVILADYSLREFSASEALQLLMERGFDIPFIVVSGRISDVQAANFIKGGASDFLLKDRLARLGPSVQQALHHKFAREDQRRLETALRESEEKHRLICETTTDAVIVLDADSRIQYANAAIHNVFGYVPAEVVGKDMAILQPDRFREGHTQAVKRFIQSGVKTRDWGAVERLGLHRDGREIPLEITYTYADKSGTPFFVGFLRDITARKEAAERIGRLNRLYAVLSGINTLIVRVHDRQELFEQSCRVVVEQGGFPFAWIGVLNPTTQDVTPAAWAGEDAEALLKAKFSARDDIQAGMGAVGRALRERRTVYNNDLVNKGFGGPRLKNILRLGYRSQITLPLFSDKTVMGTLTMYAREPNFFDAEELKLLTELADDISFALDNIVRQQRVDKMARIRAVSSEVNAAIVRIRERKGLLKEICRIAVEHGKFDLTWAALLDEDAQRIDPVAWTGFSADLARAVTWTTLADPRVTLNEVLRTRQLAVRNDVDAESTAGILRKDALRLGYRSTVCLPFLVDGKVVAAVTLFAAGRGFFDIEEIALLTEVSNDISFALDYISKSERLNYLAYYDATTGLPNRTLILEYVGRVMRRAKEEQTEAAVLMFDIKRFRNINDSFGRQAGDALLRTMAQRLRLIWPESDNLGHIGADCFVGLLANVKGAADIAHLFEKSFDHVLGRPVEIAGKEIRVTVTSGIALFPSDGENAEALLGSADAALKNAKAEGQRYLFYHRQMNEAVAETLLLENKMRYALENEEFVLHYQPKINLMSGAISGMEALIRWNDPDNGLVAPGQFIHILEESGLILEVGRWAMCRALQDYHQWSEQGLQPPRIAVNVSAIQLRQKNFVEVVQAAIRDAGENANGLDLEITESLLMDNIEDSIDKVQRLRAIGINLAIDDFGTGYSSLGYLAKLPVNALKIDRSFILSMTDNSDSMAIVSTIISLAHSLNMKVVAEGVETEEQSRFLRLLRCDEVQGYFLSKPLPSCELADFLRKEKNNRLE